MPSDALLQVVHARLQRRDLRGDVVALSLLRGKPLSARFDMTAQIVGVADFGDDLGCRLLS